MEAAPKAALFEKAVPEMEDREAARMKEPSK